MTFEKTGMINKVWERMYDKLEIEMELDRISWVITRKCKCKTQDCHHYKRYRDKKFGKVINYLWDFSMKGFKIFVKETEETLLQAKVHNFTVKDDVEDELKGIE